MVYSYIRYCRNLLGLTIALCLLANSSIAQNTAPQSWLGVTMPPQFEPHSSPVINGDNAPEHFRIPPDEPHWPELDGNTIREDLQEIVAFSKQSRAQQEVGNGQLWGRISGFPSARKTVEWANKEFIKAGIKQVELQEFEQAANAQLWLPLQWEVKLKASPAFGKDTRDYVFETAMPLSPSELPIEGLQGSLVYVGRGSPAELIHTDVKGKIAIQRITPQAHMVFVRRPTVPRAQLLFERGALAVINIVDLPGNERARDFSNCGGPCFNLGGQDGRFLELVMNRAAEREVFEKLTIEMHLQSEHFSGMHAQNSIAVIPGDSEETIVLNAHIDAWFDGAGDNGDGLAVLIALAKHFALTENKPKRTLVFVASAGHHSTGLHGPRNFVRMNPAIIKNTVLAINIEHVAQRNIVRSRVVAEDGYREFMTDSGEAPITAGITNNAPFLENLVAEGIQRYGTNFVSGKSNMASGEGGGYRNLGFPIVTTMQAPPLYHTSGEVEALISTPGLERMARFLAFFVKAVGEAQANQISPDSDG